MWFPLTYAVSFVEENMGVLTKTLSLAALLELSKLRQVEHNYGWGDLVLPPGHRKVVQAMVETHATYKPDGHPATGNGRGAWKR